MDFSLLSADMEVLTEEEHHELMRQLCFADATGDLDTHAALAKRLQHARIETEDDERERVWQEYKAQAAAEESGEENNETSDAPAWAQQKKQKGEKRLLSEVSEEEREKIVKQIDDFFSNVPPQGEQEPKYRRRVAAAIARKIEEQFVKSIQEMWRREEIPVLRLEADGTDLGVLLPTPLDREILKSGNTILDPSSKFLCSVQSLQSISEDPCKPGCYSMSERVTAPLHANVLPSTAKFGLAAERAAELPAQAGKNKKGEVQGTETGKIARICMEQLRGLLHMLFHLPAERSPDLPPGPVPDDHRALIVEFMGDVGGSALPAQRLTLQSVVGWAESAAYPVLVVPGFCWEHMAQTLTKEASQPLRATMVPTHIAKAKAKAAAAKKQAAKAKAKASAGGAGKAAAPNSKAAGGGGSNAQQRNGGGKAAAAGARLNGAEYLEKDEPVVQNEFVDLLIRRANDPVNLSVGGRDPLAGGFDWGNDVTLGFEQDDGDQDHADGAAAAAGEGANAAASGAAAGGNAGGDSAEKKKEKTREREFFSQFSYTFNKLINHQKRNLLFTLRNELEKKDSTHVDVWPRERKDEWERERKSTQSLLEMHSLWDSKQNGEISFALRDGKVCMLLGAKASLAGVADELSSLLPSVRPGSDTRWFTIVENAGLGVGFGCLRKVFDKVQMTNVHVGNGDFTPENFGYQSGSETTAVDWALLSHLVAIVSRPPTCVAGSTYKKAKMERRDIDINDPNSGRKRQLYQKFKQAASSSFDNLTRENFREDCLRCLGGDRAALDAHMPGRLHALGGLMRGQAGYLWRFGSEEGHVELVEWLVRSLRELDDASEESQTQHLSTLLEQPDLPLKFRTKNMDIIDSGLIQQLRRIGPNAGRRRIVFALHAYWQLNDNHSIKVEWYHMILQSCQRANKQWRGDKALNAITISTFVGRSTTDEFEQKLKRTVAALQREEAERLAFCSELVRYQSGCQGSDKWKLRAYQRTLRDDVEFQGGTKKQYEQYHREKRIPEKAAAWMRQAIDIATELRGIREASIEDLESKRVELELEIFRRKPQKEFWANIKAEMVDSVCEIPIRRLKEFERDCIWAIEARGAAPPMVHMGFTRDVPEDLDVLVPDYSSAVGRFVNRIFTANKERLAAQRLSACPEYLAVVLAGKVWVIFWSIGKPAGFVAFAVADAFGTPVDLSELLQSIDDSSSDKVLFSFDSQLEKPSAWDNFAWVRMVEHEDLDVEVAGGGEKVAFVFVSDVDRDAFLNKEDREMVEAETGLRLEAPAPRSKKPLPSQRVVGGTLMNFITLQEQGQFVTARAFLDAKQKDLQKRRLHAKMTRVRKLTLRQNRDKQAAEKIRQRHKDEATKTREGMEDELVEQLIDGAKADVIMDFTLDLAKEFGINTAPRGMVDMAGEDEDAETRRLQAQLRMDEDDLFADWDELPVAGQAASSVIISAANAGPAGNTTLAAASGGASSSSSAVSGIPLAQQAGRGTLGSPRNPSAHAIERPTCDDDGSEWEECPVLGWTRVKAARASSRDVTAEEVRPGSSAADQAELELFLGDANHELPSQGLMDFVAPLRRGGSKSPAVDDGSAPRLAGGSTGNPASSAAASSSSAAASSSSCLAYHNPDAGLGAASTTNKRSRASLRGEGTPAARAEPASGLRMRGRTPASRSPGKPYMQYNHLHSYKQQLAAERARVDRSHGGFELTLRGDAAAFKKKGRAAKTLQVRPKLDTREGRAIQEMWDYDKARAAGWLCCQTASLMKQRDFKEGKRQTAEDYLNLWIARARFIAQRYVKEEFLLNQMTKKIPFATRSTAFKTQFTKYIEPFLKAAEDTKTENSKRESDQIEELKTLPEALLRKLSIAPIRKTQ